MGGAADQGLLARRAMLGSSVSARAHVDDADRGVPVPAARARPDVGAFQRAGRGARVFPVHLKQRCVSIRHDGGRVDERSSLETTASEQRASPSTRSSRASRCSELVLEPRPARPDRRAAAARAAALPRPLPRRADDDARRSRSRTTGSTSTTPGRAPGACRTSAPGARHGRAGTTCLGVEYFCFEGDEIWEMPDEEAVELAKAELARDRAARPGPGLRRRQGPRAQGVPHVRRAYREAVDVLREYLARFENLKTFGRNGLHRYNNQDHSMWTAILATLNLVDGRATTSGR